MHRERFQKITHQTGNFRLFDFFKVLLFKSKERIHMGHFLMEKQAIDLKTKKNKATNTHTTKKRGRKGKNKERKEIM